MSPVIDKIYVDAYQPFSEQKISMQEALDKGAQPLRAFMLRQTREADLALFARLANSGPLQGPEAVPMRILLPAYVTSELKTAFQIGFTIFYPFFDYRHGDRQRIDGVRDDDGAASDNRPAV